MAAQQEVIYDMERGEARLEQSALCPEGESVFCCFLELIKWDLAPFSQAIITRWVSRYLVTTSLPSSDL